MRTELDRRMDATMAALTAPDGMLALGTAERFGVTLPMIACETSPYRRSPRKLLFPCSSALVGCSSVLGLVILDYGRDFSERAII